MTDYLTEQEQIELLKNWIKQYALVILAGIAIAFITIYSWRYWQERQNKILTHASAVYDEMLTNRAQNDENATLIQAQKLFTHYANTPYGQLAALMLARDAIRKNNYSEAEKNLRWVIKKSSVPSIRQIARLRLGRLFITEQKSDEALHILKKVEDKNFNGLIDEVRGDAYLAQKNNAMAQNAYQNALKELPNAEVVRPLLQMKYDNVASLTQPTS